MSARGRARRDKFVGRDGTFDNPAFRRGWRLARRCASLTPCTSSASARRARRSRGARPAARPSGSSRSAQADASGLALGLVGLVTLRRLAVLATGSTALRTSPRGHADGAPESAGRPRADGKPRTARGRAGFDRDRYTAAISRSTAASPQVQRQLPGPALPRAGRSVLNAFTASWASGCSRVEPQRVGGGLARVLARGPAHEREGVVVLPVAGVAADRRLGGADRQLRLPEPDVAVGDQLPRLRALRRPRRASPAPRRRSAVQSPARTPRRRRRAGSASATARPARSPARARRARPPAAAGAASAARAALAGRARRARSRRPRTPRPRPTSAPSPSRRRRAAPRRRTRPARRPRRAGRGRAGATRARPAIASSAVISSASPTIPISPSVSM